MNEYESYFLSGYDDKLQKDTKILNGREQKKIENFLKEQNIKTKAFRRGDN
ncbi:hypothetical protein [Mammaliicoccus lentus]|uniref:hypothetical protein n=1 Tax=Mammaliicoccus lentus TaxID=42858 RepID=UPI001C4FFADF|nr:hypothetical protein [Mammaliicoccus lentus]MBW0762950.1 hypothetical protein [Mammaliicoccus lentus]